MIQKTIIPKEIINNIPDFWGRSMQTINQQLKLLYQSTVGGTSDMLAGFGVEGLSAPMLIKFADDRTVETADLRVMFFGQETQDKIKDNTVDVVMDDYCNFFNDFNEYEQIPANVKHCWQLQKSRGRSGTWCVLEQMRNAINERLTCKRVSYIWNNIVKANYLSTGHKVPADVYAKFRNANRKLILGEIEIIKPDVLVFFTGPKYDRKIDDVFNNGQRFDKDEIVIDGNNKILAKAPLPGYGDAYVSYHPLALGRTKAKDLVLNAIVEQCTAVAMKT